MGVEGVLSVRGVQAGYRRVMLRMSHARHMHVLRRRGPRTFLFISL